MDTYFIRFFQDLSKNLTKKGLNHNYILLDNESYPAFKGLLKDNKINYQMDPPVMQHHNTAERSISTFKKHLNAGICAMNPDFPMQNWTAYSIKRRSP